MVVNLSVVVAELAPSGLLKAALNLGNPVLVQRDPFSDSATGVTVDIAREIGRRLNIPVVFEEFKSAGAAVEAMKSAACDIAFLAIDPLRARDIAFTAPYVTIEGTYVVSKERETIRTEDVDRDGIRIGVSAGSANDLFLSRTIKKAELVRTKNTTEALSYLDRRADVVAGVRQPLSKFVVEHFEFRVMEDRFMEINQALGVRHGVDAAARYTSALIEELKKSGFVADALRRSGQSDDLVSPAAERATGQPS